MKNLKIVLLTLAISTLAISAPNNPPTFEEYDTDKNGIVTEQEFDALKTQRMTQRAEEGMQMRNAGNAPMFSDFDKNGDGEITKEELRLMQQEKMQNNMGKGNKSPM